MFKFFSGKKGPPLHKIETVIGSNTSFNGHLKCDGHVRIDGICEGGVIETVGNVVVAQNARVAAKIIAEHVSVAGEVTGAIHARGRLEILSTGRVSGDVRVANFYKDEAAVLSGRLIMGEEALETEARPSPKPSEEADDSAAPALEPAADVPAASLSGVNREAATSPDMQQAENI